jgi:hypothetical protein
MLVAGGGEHAVPSTKMLALLACPLPDARMNFEPRRMVTSNMPLTSFEFLILSAWSRIELSALTISVNQPSRTVHRAIDSKVCWHRSVKERSKFARHTSPALCGALMCVSCFEVPCLQWSDMISSGIGKGSDGHSWLEVPCLQWSDMISSGIGKGSDGHSWLEVPCRQWCAAYYGTNSKR